MHQSRRRHWFAALASLALITLACTCSLGEQLGQSLSEPTAAEGDGNDGTQASESKSVQATLNPEAESALSPTPGPSMEPPQPSFRNVYFASAVSESGEPVGVAADFPSGTMEVYSFASWSGMQDGISARSVWTLDGEPATESEFSWNLGPAGDDIWVGNIYRETGSLQEGQYTWQLMIDGEPMISANFSIGSQASILLQDDFGDPSSGWEIGEYDVGSVGYEGGAYAATSSKENEMMWGLAYDVFFDVEIQVEATQVQAPANNNNAYGVMCRVREGGTGYLLRISGDGYYSIILVDQDGSFRPLVDWAASDAIRQGNSSNQIRAICDEGYFALYANGAFLAEAWDDTFRSGDIALTTTSFEPDPSRVVFDNIIVTSR
jgi:hypothetical protein